MQQLRYPLDNIQITESTVYFKIFKSGIKPTTYFCNQSKKIFFCVLLEGLKEIDRRNSFALSASR